MLKDTCTSCTRCIVHRSLGLATILKQTAMLLATSNLVAWYLYEFVVFDTEDRVHSCLDSSGCSTERTIPQQSVQDDLSDLGIIAESLLSLRPACVHAELASDSCCRSYNKCRTWSVHCIDNNITYSHASLDWTARHFHRNTMTQSFMCLPHQRLEGPTSS